MEKMKHWTPLARGASIAVVYGLIVLVLAQVNGAPFDATLLLWILLAAATALVYQEAIDGCTIHRGSPDWGKADTALSAYIWGLGFAIPLALASLPGADGVIDVLLRWALAGAVYGAFMVYTMSSWEYADDIARGYALEKSWVQETKWGWLLYANPIFTVAVLVIILSFGDISPDGSFYIWFFLIVTLSHLARFPAKGPFWATPRFVGLMLLFVAIVVNHSSTSSTSA